MKPIEEWSIDELHGWAAVIDAEGFAVTEEGKAQDLAVLAEIDRRQAAAIRKGED